MVTLEDIKRKRRLTADYPIPRGYNRQYYQGVIDGIRAAMTMDDKRDAENLIAELHMERDRG